MKILAIEPYFGGSHKSFLDGWIGRSEHEWVLLTEAANKWKWRMRISAVSFADEVNRRYALGERWDVLFCSDMLNLAEFLGLVDERVREIPSIVYFHENQLTYPNQVESERDYQYVVTNMTTALAADRVWFNSEFHKNEFTGRLGKFIKKIPTDKPGDIIERILGKSSVEHPGIDVPAVQAKSEQEGPMRIVWAARWEHDKNPEDFFAAVKRLSEMGVEFRLSVIGEHFREIPEVFETARKEFDGLIDRWGYQPSREEYITALLEADVVVSTAVHEFFGISVVEAVACGGYPVLPRRLSYPEITAGIEKLEEGEFLYDGTVEGLAGRLAELAGRYGNNDLWRNEPERGIIAMQEYDWETRAAEMDKAITETV